MRFSNLVFVLVVGIVGAGLAFGQATQSTTGPADVEGARAAAKALARAIADGNVEAIKGLVDAPAPGDEKMRDSMAAMAQSLARLRQAAVRAFGEVNARDLVGTVVTAEEAARKFDSAEIKIDGDTATVSAKDARLVLKHVGGEWKVPMGEMAKGVKPEDVDAKVKEQDGLRKIIDEVADDVGAGKFKTADEAAAALRGKATPGARVEATQPATTRGK